MMYKYLLYFLIFSFLGWCTEVIFQLFKTKKFINRGLAHGPVCPIYGLGISLCAALLSSVKSFLLLVVFSMAIATVTELAVGYFTDKILGMRLWDYSFERGNISGYICPRFSLVWGVVCATVIKLLPFLDGLISLFDGAFLKAVSYLILIFVIVDLKTAIKKSTAHNNV